MRLKQLNPKANPRVIYGTSSGAPIYRSMSGDNRPDKPYRKIGPFLYVAMGRSSLVAMQSIPSEYIPGFQLGGYQYREY